MNGVVREVNMNRYEVQYYSKVLKRWVTYDFKHCFEDAVETEQFLVSQGYRAKIATCKQ